MRATVANSEPLLALIRRVEARSDYNIVFGGIPAAKRPRYLTEMTVGDVIAWQKKVTSEGAKSSAAGAYQIIRKTLESLVAGGNASKNERFSREVQDRLAVALLTRRGFQDYLSGKTHANVAMIALAKEWASFPVPRDMNGASRFVKAGQSYYAGDGLNKALVTVSEVRATIERCKNGAPAATPEEPTGLIAAILKIIANLFGGRK